MPVPESLTRATAVVVNFNLPEMTRRCVEALIGDGLPPERIVIVENGSEASSVELITAAFPDSSLLILEKNIGYARAANRGAALQPADTYFFVNNDAFVEQPGTLERLAVALDRPGVGIVVPRLLNEDKTLQRNAVPLLTPLVALALATGMSRFIPNRLQPFWSTWWDHSASQVVAAARGAVLGVRADCWNTLGGWMEEDWMFGEDLDLSWQASKLGWKTWFQHDAVFVHLGHATISVDRERMRLTSTATRRVIERALPPSRAAVSLAMMSSGHAARAVAFRAAGKREASDCAVTAARAYLPFVRPNDPAPKPVPAVAGPESGPR
ncbi:MAG TPA: glycosyltransferase family 2 protein [Gaiellaceae bacterium]|nr:glycosyltransferase family 2 protein [Gaiellaceae bacterium]